MTMTYVHGYAMGILAVGQICVADAKPIAAEHLTSTNVKLLPYTHTSGCNSEFE